MSTSPEGPGLRRLLDAGRFGLWRTLKPVVALAVAGLDPSGGAGIIADVRTFDALGVYGEAVATTLTVQSTRGMSGRHDVSTEVIREQLESLFEDRRPDAVKVGALGNTAIICELARFLREVEYRGPLVVDPVLASSSGVALLDDDGLAALKGQLLPRASIITPNVREVSLLCGFEVFEEKDVETAALRLVSMGARAALVTGCVTVEKRRKHAADVLCDEGGIRLFTSPWIEGEGAHGTGCVLSSAIAAEMALGRGTEAAVSAARKFVRGAIEAAVEPGTGAAVANPYTSVRSHEQRTERSRRGQG